MTIRIYADHVDDTALDQFTSAMAQPGSVHGALMPDVHAGYTLPIGAVVATRDIVYPSWVGYDIGCGVLAHRLQGIPVAVIREHAVAIHKEIHRLVPTGFNKHQVSVFGELYDISGLTEQSLGEAVKKKLDLALGTLGGGNHFIEIGYGEVSDEITSERPIWISIHSGSRGVGHGIATNYMKQAHPDGKAKEGHHGFRKGSVGFDWYIQDQNWCLEYALDNRRTILYLVLTAIENVIGKLPDAPTLTINRNHNHVVQDSESGLWIHRKGATHAEKGMMGVIPGNMHDGVFIVRGKGAVDALNSSSHGAGRVLGRKQAKRELDAEEFVNHMKFIVSDASEKTLDEAPKAYKNIFDVMDQQQDLVEVVDYVIPLINVKG